MTHDYITDDMQDFRRCLRTAVTICNKYGYWIMTKNN